MKLRIKWAAIFTECTSMQHFFLLRFFLSSLLKALILLVLTLSIKASHMPTLLEKILASGELRVVTIPGPNTLFDGHEGTAGFEFQLASDFAERLGLKLVLTEAESHEVLFDMLRSEEADIAASNLVVTPKRQQEFLFSPPYTSLTTRFYYRYGSNMPRSWEDIRGREIVVSGFSHHEERLQEMKQTYPWLKWQVDHTRRPYELMALVQQNDIDLTIMNSSTFLLNQGLFPKVRPALLINEDETLAWALAKNGDLSLYNTVELYFSMIARDGTLDDLQETYFTHLNELNSGGSNMFYQRIRTRLPKYRALFEEAADEYQLDWHLLAAMSYQESFWNPKAVSPTGVRGLMMLTQVTAKSLGIQNRSDPLQSVRGGAAYLAQQKSRLPETINEPDRTWLALAAYNAGFGHLEDARILTARYGGNPDKWRDVRKHFPLLMEKAYFSTVPYGYARGEETVNYVQRIRHYYAVLSWRSRMHMDKP